MERLFISSVQKELQKERNAIRDFVSSDALLRQFFSAFLFEELPPTDRRPDELYLDEVTQCSIYVGIFGNEYGWEDDEGLSPTEKEYRHAGAQHKRRLIFIKGRDEAARAPKMTALIQRVGDELVRKRFEDIEELQRLLYGSLINYLQDTGRIVTHDYDAAVCEGLTMEDLSRDKVRWFLERARLERRYALASDTPMEKVLAHLNLLAGEQPLRGAVLLFGDEPTRYVPASDVNCLHFHGTHVVKPIPSQQVYRGTLFELVDSSVDFVMEKLARQVVPGEGRVASDVQYDIPFKVVREALVNAVAHRNYASKAGIQVMVFSDRIEVWNPGGLPEDMTVEMLRKPHHSVPRNRLLCEVLFLAHYIERAGTGTLDMIRLCADKGLPEPQFRNEGEHFVTVVWRNWLTDTLVEKLRLNERQKKAIGYLKTNGRISNKEYQQVTKAIKKTASRDLADLKNKQVVEQVGSQGAGVYYLLRNGDIMGT